MVSVSTGLIAFTVLIDILIAVSIPFFPALGLDIVRITFTNVTADGTSVFVNDSNLNMGFNGQLDSVTVKNLTDLQVSLVLRFYLNHNRLG